ncbi:MAG: hypothetical protein EHM89_14610, partial [Acidobacteria bacterium]
MGHCTRSLVLFVPLLVGSLALHAQQTTPPPLPDATGSRPAAAVDTMTIDSRILGRQRQAHVALPPSFGRTTRRYPVIVVLDGEASFGAAASIARTLSELGHIPESIVVAVPNASRNPADRVHDMTP